MGLSDDLSDGFFDGLRGVCSNLRCEPVDLLSVMMSESQVRATAHNPNGDASSLIQFMPQTLANLGWTQGHAAFRQLTAEQQLPFVEKYFASHVAQGLSSAARLYQATFLPATLNMGSSPDTVIAATGGINGFAVPANPAFDINHDGRITVGELQAAIDRNARGARWDEIVARLNGTPVDTTIDLKTVAGVQAALTALGFDPGGVDGVSGPRTRAAILAFQQGAELAADGIVGPMTRAALGRALDGAGIAHRG